MTNLSQFEITKKWPAQDPSVLQLYSFPTPNGVKVSIALEEMGIAYEPHLVSFATDDQLGPEFISLNPNNKIPSIIDPDGPDGTPMPLWESGAILIYLAEKTGKLLSKDPAKRYETLQWLMFQMGGLGPMFGQLGFFHMFAGKDIEDPRPKARYVEESARLLEVLDGQLEGRDWIVGDYSIADISVAPWLRAMRDFYKGGDLVGWDDLENVPAYLDRFLARPAVQAGLHKPALPE
ncbi:MAG: glutathione S-transferase N-terminal domain-containing protein [Rhodobacteraceae bacterium]|nr:glutathione S-transferase N-terminal domain-containing protein [Paracoccaceae bacterium]